MSMGIFQSLVTVFCIAFVFGPTKVISISTVHPTRYPTSFTSSSREHSKALFLNSTFNSTLHTKPISTHHSILNSTLHPTFDSIPIMMCEYHENAVFFKFPNLLQEWKAWNSKANHQNKSFDSSNHERLDFFIELKHRKRLLPKRFPMQNFSDGSLGKEIARSKLEIPSNLRFRIIAIPQIQKKSETNNKITENEHNSSLRQTTNTIPNKIEYVIQEFRYKSRPVPKKSKNNINIHSWAKDWRIVTNQDCFNFTTPYMVEMRCNFLTIMYCARQQLTQAYPPDLKVDEDQVFNLSDESWNAEHCVRLDRDCHKCRFRVSTPLPETPTNHNGGKSSESNGRSSRKVCVEDTQTHGAPVTWKCEMVLNQCEKDDKLENISNTCGTCALLSAVIGVLAFVILCGVSYTCYQRRRRNRKKYQLGNNNEQGTQMNEIVDYGELHIYEKVCTTPPQCGDKS